MFQGGILGQLEEERLSEKGRKKVQKEGRREKPSRIGGTLKKRIGRKTEAKLQKELSYKVMGKMHLFFRN